MQHTETAAVIAAAPTQRPMPVALITKIIRHRVQVSLAPKLERKRAAT